MPSNNKSERGATGGVGAVQYIRENFEPGDRLAVVLLNKRAQEVIQRIASAEKIAAQDFQAWLRFQNTTGYEIYISMNALTKTARGRTKADIETIRHVYLDFDERGTAAVENLLAREDLPEPNYLIHTSPDKWQAVWKVQGFEKDQAEDLLHMLVREMGADPAATDCTRVLRLPGFYNHKYSEAFRITAQAHASETYRPERFPQPPEEETASGVLTDERRRYGGGRVAPAKISQSERDWAYATRALARGEPQDLVVAALANWRRYDKHDSRYYAELTVRKAAEALNSKPGAARSSGHPER